MRQYQQHARILEVTTDNVRVPLPGYDTEHYTVDELVELINTCCVTNVRVEDEQ